MRRFVWLAVTAFFSLTLECFAVTPGESCDAPLEAGALPWEAVVNEGVSDDLVVSVCEGNAESTGAPDAVLSFTPPQDGLYRVSLPAWTEGVGPSAFAVTDGCGLTVEAESTEDEALLGTDSCYGGTRGDAPLEVYLAGGETVFIALERLPGDAPGPQTVRVESACTPTCDGRECGDDGCGERYGDCADGSFCLEEAGICF